MKVEVTSRPGEGRNNKQTKLVLSGGDWCFFLSWCLVVGIGVSIRFMSTNICKILVSLTELVLSGGDWCLRISVR
jgi:hypothetical protein